MPASLIDPLGLAQQGGGMPTDRASGQAWLQKQWRESTSRGDVGQANNPNNNRCGTIGIQFESCQEQLDDEKRKAEEQGKKPKAGEAGALTDEEIDELVRTGNLVIREMTDSADSGPS